MTSPHDPELLLAYLAGEMPAAEAAALEARLKNEPALADHYLTLARDEAVLAEWAKLHAGAVPEPAEPAKLAPPSRKRRLVFAAAAVVALAASILLAAGVYFYPWSQPAAASGPVAVVEDVQGEVMLVVNGEPTPVANGQALFDGAELRTGGEGSYAVVRFPDAARLELSADTIARLEKGAPRTKRDAGSRRVFVSSGQLTAEVTQTPMVLATPHAEVLADDGRFVCNIAKSGTCVEPEKGQVRVTRRGHAAVDVAPGFYLVADNGTETKPRRRPTPANAPLATLSDAPGPIPTLVCTADGGTLISGSADGTVRFWDVATRQLKSTIKAYPNAVRLLAVSPDGLTLATAGHDRTLRVWDVRTGEEKYTLPKRAEIECVAFSPEGSTLAVGSAAGKDGFQLRLYDVVTGLPVGAALRTANPKSAITALAFADDGRTLATGDRDGIIRLWTLTDNPLRDKDAERFRFEAGRILQAHTQEVRALVFAPNGAKLASAGRDGAAFVWDVAAGVTVLQIAEPGREVRSVAFSPDGSLLATGGGDGTARIWQTRDGLEYAQFHSHKHNVTRVLFLDETTLVTSGSDKFIKLWKLPPTRPDGL
jgi:ferric-dicitrate binding protein FerR (iron transport regulator)